MSVSFDDLRTLLGEVPPTATIRVACAGESFYVSRDGLELTTTADGAYLKLQGRTGASQDAMTVGAVIVNPERVDFIQVLVS
jgi:hypothetical protein